MTSEKLVNARNVMFSRCQHLFTFPCSILFPKFDWYLMTYIQVVTLNNKEVFRRWFTIKDNKLLYQKKKVGCEGD